MPWSSFPSGDPSVSQTSFNSLPETTSGEEPGVIIAEEGEPVNITCRFHHHIDRALCLNRTVRKPMQVLYVAVPENRTTEAPEYANRTKYFEMNNTVTITVERVKPNDSDVYMCKGLLLRKGEPTEISSGSIMLAVKGKGRGRAIIIFATVKVKKGEHLAFFFTTCRNITFSWAHIAYTHTLGRHCRYRHIASNN